MLSKKLKMKIMAAVLATVMTIGMSTSVFAYELLGNNHFENGIGLPWNVREVAPAQADWEVSNGKYNITVTQNGPEPLHKWDVRLRHGGLTLKQGRRYNVQFTIESPVDCKVYAKISEAIPLTNGVYVEYWHNFVDEWQPFQVTAGVPLVVNQNFDMKDPTSSNCEFSFDIANGMYTGPLPHLVSFSNIHLDESLPPAILVGDVNGDIKVNMLDYIMLKKHITGTIPMLPYEYGEKAADVNGDGKVNILDYVLIKNFISGKIVTFPA